MGKKKFNKANEWTKEIGDLKFVMEFQVVVGYTNTCSALQYLAEMEESIKKNQKNETNYAPVFQKLLDAFDAYIKERFKKNKRKTGDRRNFKLTNINDLTICLAWQLRHILVHKGGVVDESSMSNYNLIISKVRDESVLDKLCIPLKLELGDKVEIDFDTYVTIKNCFYDYLDRRHTPEEMRIFRARGSIVMKNLDGDIVINMGTFQLKIEISDIYSVGGEIDFKTMLPKFPCKARFNPKDEVIELENGKSIKAIPMPLPF